MASEFLTVAEHVLETERRPLRPREIVNIALERGLFSGRIAGKTPHQTMKAKLSVHVRRKGTGSIFVRTRPGAFYLRRLIHDPRAIFEARPLAPPPDKDRVLVFPTNALPPERRFQGVDRAWRRYTKLLLRGTVCTHLPRQQAEFDDDHKQIVTYVLVTRRGSLLAYKRGNYSRAEEFLRGSHCVGFGGHVALSDIDLFHRTDQGVTRCAIRELGEELALPAADRLRLSQGTGLEIVGVLNDDSSPNGRRHFAFVLRYEVSDHPNWERPGRNEKSVTQLRWIHPRQDALRLWDFEYWSQLCLLKFFMRSDITEPSYRVVRKSRLRPPRILVILGQVGSGKSQTTRILKSDFGYAEVNSGRVLARILGIPPVNETSRRSFQEKAAEFIRRPTGPFELASAIVKGIGSAKKPRVLVDGVRHRTTLRALRDLASATGLGVIYVHTPPHVAFSFYRKRTGNKATLQRFLDARNSSVEQEVDGLIGESDAVLYNWRGQAQYRRIVNEMMTEAGIPRIG